MQTETRESQAYLNPYRQAAGRYGDRFASLLWASPRTQAARFDAITRLYNMHQRRVLDAGCGRADLLDFFRARRIEPTQYIGIEAVDELAAAAQRKHLPNASIIHADFVREPQHLNVEADVIVFSGSLNTLEASQFQQTLAIAWEAARRALVFNFLSAAHLANARWLRWHRTQHVLAMAQRWSSDVRMLDDYLDGDTTVAVYKQAIAS